MADRMLAFHPGLIGVILVGADQEIQPPA
jgi:hypothetical protein